MNRSRKKCPTTQRGGVVPTQITDENDKIITDPGDLLDFFLLNSKFELLNLRAGSYGITVTATFQHGKKSRSGKTLISPYVGFRSPDNKFAERVDQLLLKFNLISNDGYSIEEPNRWSKMSITRAEFVSECEAHRHIVESTIGNLEPIAPIIVHSAILSNKIACDMFELISSNASNKYTKDYSIQIKQKLRGCDVGILAMEFFKEDDFKLAYDKLNDANKTMALILYEMVCLTLNGYAHGDHHMGNFLISDNYNGYFLSGVEENDYWVKNKRCIIIDFGRSRKLTDVEIAIVRNITSIFTKTPNAKNLQDIMRVIYGFGTFLNNRAQPFSIFDEDKQNLNLKENFKKLLGKKPIQNMYDWIIGASTPEVANYVNQLFNARSQAIIEKRKQTTHFVTDFLNSYHRLSPKEKEKYSANTIAQIKSHNWSMKCIQSLLNNARGQFSSLPQAIEPARTAVERRDGVPTAKATLENYLHEYFQTDLPVSAKVEVIPMAEMINVAENISPVIAVIMDDYHGGIVIRDFPNKIGRIHSVSIMVIILLSIMQLISSKLLTGGSNSESVFMYVEALNSYNMGYESIEKLLKGDERSLSRSTTSRSKSRGDTFTRSKSLPNIRSINRNNTTRPRSAPSISRTSINTKSNKTRKLAW